MERPLKDTEREQLRQKLLGIRDVIDDVLDFVSIKTPVRETIFNTREEARVAARLTDGKYKVQKHPKSGWILVTK